MEKCPRCKKPVKDRGVTVQGILYGPSCGRVVYRRQRARESFGDVRVEITCSCSGKSFYAGEESRRICPDTLCTYCRYNTISHLAVELCPLEVEAKQRELKRWS